MFLSRPIVHLEMDSTQASLSFLLSLFKQQYNVYNSGSGCGLVGRAITWPWFESSHQQNFTMNIFTVNC